MSEDELSNSLGALSAFFVGNATMAEALHHVAKLAESAIEPARFVGLTMMAGEKASTAVFTDPQSPEIDQAQYRSGRGPCLHAFRTGEVHVVASTERDTLWPEFSRACLDHGIHSTLSMPVAVEQRRLGAINFYSHEIDAFREQEIKTASTFASQAAIVLGNAQAYWDARRLSEQLTESIASRAVIEQAKGIIMATMRCTADDAFEQLITQSQLTNTKLRTVAQDIVSNATRDRRV